jgi:hypothetical protein
MSQQFIQIVFEAKEEYLQGLLAGYRMAKGIELKYFFNHAAGVKAESLSEKIKEWSSLSDKFQYVILEQGLYTLLKESGDASGPVRGAGYKILSARRILSGLFSVKVKDASPVDTAAIKQLVADKPAELQTIAWQEKEIRDEQGKGVELYTPVHEFVFHASGSFKGPIEALIAFRLRLTEHSALSAKEIELEFID